MYRVRRVDGFVAVSSDVAVMVPVVGSFVSSVVFMMSMMSISVLPVVPGVLSVVVVISFRIAICFRSGAAP